MKDAIVFSKVDINSPLDKEGEILDTQKIDEACKSISWCLRNGAYTVVVLSHQGRKKEESLKPHCKILEKYFSGKITLTKRDGKEAVDAICNAKKGSIVIMENTRSDDEEANYDDVKETKIYKTLKEVEKKSGRKIVYVKDDFSVCHRKDLTIYGLPLQLKKEGYSVVAGPVIKQEYENITMGRHKLKDGNIICVWGGKKYEDYMKLFKSFIESYPNSIVLTAGPLSILLQKAMGRDVGKNAEAFKITPDLVEKAIPIIKKYKGRVLTPVDYYVENSNGREVVDSRKSINGGGIIVDIGPKTVVLYKNIIKENPESIIIGNGPLGQYEKEENRKGTKAVYKEIFNPENRNFVMGGGGDFNAVMNILGFEPQVRSTGGKAFIECIVNGFMPGLEPIMNKEVAQETSS